MPNCFDFETLTTDCILDAVEKESGKKFLPLVHPHPSYINRVYELKAEDGSRIIAKFYRPGRWPIEAIIDEHDFILDCEEAEIPVIAPLPLLEDFTIGRVNNVYFSLYPYQFGRGFELITDEDWQRLGRLLGRLHAVGSKKDAPNRVVLHPRESTENDLDHILDSGILPPHHADTFERLVVELIDLTAPLFEDIHYIRVHGDCHAANILCGRDDALMLIDFDDMAMAPAVQDLWMLLPDHATKARREIDLILTGYEVFHSFDDSELQLIEPLRAMRMVYFLAWRCRQIQDPGFLRQFPEWGNEAFWNREITALEQQIESFF